MGALLAVSGSTGEMHSREMLSPGKVVSYGKAAERCAGKSVPLSTVQDTRRVVCSRSGFWDAEGCAIEGTCSPSWVESPSALGNPGQSAVKL